MLVTCYAALMGELKAIETTYRGCRFRSRLEARWAVVFDALGMSWEYEAQGYRCTSRVSLIDSGPWAYLPDFWLPTLKLYVEVKGSLTPDEHLRFMDNAASLCDRTDTRAVLLGAIPDRLWMPAAYSMYKGCLLTSPMLPSNSVVDGRWTHDPTLIFSRADAAALNICVAHDVGGDWHQVTREACDADTFAVSPDPAQGYPASRAFWSALGGPNGEIALRLLAAYRAGRRARFEHGETPQILV